MMAATDLLNAVSTHANYPSKPLTWFLSNQLLTEEKLKSQFVVVLTSSTSRFLVVLLKTQFRKVPPVLCVWAFFKINKLLFFQSMPHIYMYIFYLGFPLYNRLVESYQNSLFFFRVLPALRILLVDSPPGGRMDSQQNLNAFILQPGSYIIKSMFCCVKPGSFSPTAVLTNPARNNKYIDMCK